MLAILICKDALSHRALGLLVDLGANLLLVPAMTDKDDPFTASVTFHRTYAQAVTVICNAPLHPSGLAAVFSSPRYGHRILEARPARAPCLCTYSLRTGHIQVQYFE